MKKLAILILVLFVIGCARKYTAHNNGPAAKPENREITAIEVKDMAAPGGEDISENILPKDGANAAREISFELKDTLFDYDSYSISNNSRAALDKAAAWLNKNKDKNILIEGHCDERGTDIYNLALGEKRAQAVRTYLAAHGVSTARLEAVTYGEEKPVCSEKSESCWQRNRRAHIMETE